MFAKNNQPVSALLLVTPVWKDSARLETFATDLARTLADNTAESTQPIRWIIADDGSEVEEQKKLQALLKRLTPIFPDVSLHFADAHRGKGSVVREAWSLHPEAEWLAFVDADGSLSPDELIRLINSARDCGQSVLAIRKKTPTTHVVASFPRAVAHHLFILAVRILVGVQCADPQCGAKVLLGSDYRKIAHTLKEDGLAFDAELLTALSEGDITWKELPVTWIEKEGGRVHPIRDAWGMLAALWKIRIRQRNGEFAG